MSIRRNALKILLLLSVNGTATGERSELQAPDPLSFEPRKHMSSQYQQAVDELCLVREERPEVLEATCETLLTTLNQTQLKSALDRAVTELPPDGEWAGIVGSAYSLVSGGDYVLSVPVEFRKVGPGQGELRWRTWDEVTRSWSGTYEIRELGAIPELHVIVEAGVVSMENNLRFGYRVESRRPGERNISHLLLESVGLDQEKMKLLEDKRQELYGKRLTSGSGVIISVPNSTAVRRTFRLRAFGRSRRKPGIPLAL